MMKFFKYGLLVLIVVIAGAIVYLATLNLNQYKPQISEQVKRATGRELVIKGNLGFALSLVPTIKAEGITFSNASWAKNPEMLKVGKFEARVALLPLLHHQVHIRKVVLENADLDLETDKAGQGNWQFKPAAKAAPAKPPAATGAHGLAGLAVGTVEIESTRLSYTDGRTGKHTVVNIKKLQMAAASESAPTKINGQLSYNNVPVDVSGKLGSFSALTADQPWPVGLKVAMGDVKLDLSGQVEHPASGKGVTMKVSLSAPSLASFKVLTGGELPSVGPLSISAALKAPDPGHAQVNDLNIKLADSDISGTATYEKPGAIPKLSARLNSRLLDVTPFMGKSKKPEKKSDRIFSKAPLPLKPLRSLDADLRLDANRLKDGDMELTRVHVALKLQNGRLDIAPAGAALAGGTLDLKASLDAARREPVLDMELVGKHIVLGQLPQLKKDSRLEGGSTDIRIVGRGTGTSMAAIMGSLNGSFLVQVGPGKIPNKGINLAGADLLLETFGKLNPLSSKEPTSALDCAVVNFKIKDGLAKTDKGIAIETSKVNLVGSGGINLKTEALDLGIRPYARKGVGLNLGSIAGAARIGGTLAHPHPVIDAANALKAGVSAGAAVATFGLSALAQGMFDKTAEDPHPCDTALGKAPSKTGARKKSAQPKSTTEKLKDKLESLFGN